MDLENVAQYLNPVKIISGHGVHTLLPQELGRLGSINPLIVTDAGIAVTPILTKVASALRDKNLHFEVFDGVDVDPSIKTVERATTIARKSRCDALVALGGGSTIDTTKATSLTASNGGKASDYEGYRDNYRCAPLPFLALPTTAGTGSEVSSAAVIIDEARKVKMVIKSPQLFSRASFLDPELLVGIPPRLAAETGIDALAHAIEAYLSPKSTFITDAMALASIKMISAHLRPLVADPLDGSAALGMLQASCMAGIAMTHAGLGLAHALAHSIGVHARVPHGQACAMVLPHVMDFNLGSIPRRYEDIAFALLRPGELAAARRAVEEVDRLIGEMGLARRLREEQIKLEISYEELAEEVFQSFLTKMNVRAVSREDIGKILCKVV